MRFRPLFGPWLSLLALTSRGTWSQPVPASNIDLNGLGQVAVAGDFDAISVYSFAGQREQYSSNGTQSVLSLAPGGLYQSLGSTDAIITSMCPFTLKNGDFVGVIVGGNFSSIAGVGAEGVALFDPSTRVFTPHPGIQGTVNALYCDTDTETVYVGGAFDAADSTNAIAWLASGSWANLPFAGFDAPVTSITKAPNGHIVFGGSFSGLGNATFNSSQPQDKLQIINLSTASITSVANTTNAQPITCPSNSSSNPSWLLQDNTPGSWTADLRFGFEPSRLRLWNTLEDGRGTKTFRFTALPNTGIMNLTYTDPATGKEAHCDASCPLAHNQSIPYQDFTFVNNIGMNGFRIDVSDWYGSGGGLSGIELFQEDIFVYAISSFNEPSCTGASNTVSDVTTTGSWYVTPSRQSVADYLTVVTGPTTVESTDIIFEPNVSESGNYSVIVYTPGCIMDSSCSARGIVNVTGTLTTNGGTTFGTQVSQTNNYDKYDAVFQGHVDARTDSFRPQVTIRPSGMEAAQLLVASRVRFGLISSTGGLNGLFDFDPSQAVVNTDFSKSAINNAGTMLEGQAYFSSLAVHDETLYAAGVFHDDTFKNIMSFANNKASSLPNGGLNDAVADIFASNSSLYVAGNFTGANNGGPSGLNSIAAYSYSNNAWVALGAGLDGPADHVVPLQMNITNDQPEMVIAFSGSFTHIRATGSSSAVAVDGLAIWVPSHNAWLQNLAVTRPRLSGQLVTYTELSNGTWLGAGTLMSEGQAISGAAGLRSSSNSVQLQQFPVNIHPSTQSSSMSKRATGSTQNITGVVTGVYDTNSGRNITIFGGHFTADGNSSDIQNLLFLNGNNNSVSGLPSGIDSNSTFMALALQDNLLFAGGMISGQVSDAVINGLVVYDMSSSSYRSPQPASLVGNDVVVNSIAVQKSTTHVYVGGAFNSTSQDLACSAVCMYDTSTNMWSPVGGGLTGTVTALYWTDNTHMLAAGDLEVNGNSTSLARFDSHRQTWTAVPSEAIPGPITAFAPANSQATSMWVAGTANNGSAYIIEIDGTNFRPVQNAFEPGTTIRGLQVLQLTQNHGSSQYLDSNKDLLIMGQLNLTGFGPASAALFNGTSFTPFLLSVSGNDEAGSISTLFSSNMNPVLVQNNFGHSRGIAVLVAFCAALGTVFLIVLIGMILNFIQRKQSGYNKVPSVPQDKNSNIQRVPPERLFGSLGSKTPGAPTV